MKKMNRFFAFLLAVALVVGCCPLTVHTSAAETGTTTIWFYNSDNWGKVYGYVYGTCGEALGGWPGTAATSDGNGWWYVDVPATPEFTIIFNDSVGGTTGQTASVNINSNVYVAMDGNSYATKAEVEAKYFDGTRVYFYNSDNWGKVYGYVYGTCGEVLGSWPGTAATSEGNGWWYVDVPATPEFTIIFNDSVGGTTGQTASVNINSNVYVAMDGNSYATKAEVEAKYPNGTRVYFYNSDNWGKVYGYVYGSCGDALGGWPGTAATSEGNGWWYVSVPASPEFTIIFNDGKGGEEGKTQTASVNINSNVYVAMDGNSYATKAEVEAKYPQTTRVWFYNSDGWTTVNAYVYGASTADPMGVWPGTAATRDGESDWWYVDVPVGPEFVIIFNNGTGAQTMDVAIDDKEQVYVTVTGSDAYADKETAEAAQKVMDEDRKGTVRVWFYNSEGWASVSAYLYGSTEPEPLGGWPGTRATRNGDRWWYIDIDVDRPFYVIFNNGSDQQSPDTQITNNTNVYVTMNQGGAYASKEEAEAAVTTLKPIISSVTTVWFYNNVGWKNVCAYAWGTANTDPLGAWPGSAAEQYEDTDWWYFTCNFPAPFYIIFNDGVEGGAQTQGVHITDSWNVYTTYQAEKKYASKEAAEAAVGETAKVYFYNTNGWSDVYAYAWGGIKGENFGPWPGTKATRESSDSYWYYVDILAGTQMSIIFNNGVDEQTMGVFIDDNVNLYVTVNDEKFASKEDAEATIDSVADILPARTNKAYTVWYYNSEGWNDVYLYVVNADSEAFFGSQPGTKMHRLGNTGWFYMNVATGFDFTVAFSDGASNATDPFTVSDKASTYFTFDGQYTSKNEVEVLLGLRQEEPEKEDPVEEPVEEPTVEDPSAEEPVEAQDNDLTGVIAGGSIVSLLVIGGYALILGKKRKKQTAA